MDHGKTIVAIIAAYKAVKCGYQAAIMAPTAILASQHLESFGAILNKFGIKCELLISSITKKKKEDILERLKNGDIDILIGTHALLEENVVFENLGLVITDEQHRFGVNQRKNLQNKGNLVDVIYMSATPIPRTLALTIFGDMDISEIKEKPAGRKDIITKKYGLKKDVNDEEDNKRTIVKRQNVLAFNNAPICCRKCSGAVKEVQRGVYVCEECGTENYDDFQKVKRYLEKNGAAPAIIIERDTGVPRKAIDYFFRNESLEIPRFDPYRALCSRCGAPIRTGVLCDNCKRITGNK